MIKSIAVIAEEQRYNIGMICVDFYLKKEGIILSNSSKEERGLKRRFD